MDTKQLFQKQYEITLKKLNERTEEDWSELLDKWQNRATLTSLGAAGVALGSAATGIGAPVGAGASLISTGIDLANALTYGGRALYDLSTGNTEKAKEHGLDAALNAAFAIPFIGDAAQAAKALKAGKAATKAGAEAAKTGVEAGKELAVIPKAAKPAVQGGVEAGKELAVIPKAAEKLPVAKAVRIGKATGRAGAAGVVGYGIGKAIEKAIDYATSEKDATKPTIPTGTRIPASTDNVSSGIFGTGDPSMSTKTEVRTGHGSRPGEQFKYQWALSPQMTSQVRQQTVDSKGRLTESKISSKVKNAVLSYLNSKEGKKLNDHLKSISKDLES